MRAILGQVVVTMLTMLLALTTPVGTEQGRHQNQLLDPVFPHVHLVDGRMLSDAQLRAYLKASAIRTATQVPPAGPALGGGSGADAGVAVGPVLPSDYLPLPVWALMRRFWSSQIAPDEYRDVPEDPPPNPLV